MESMSLGYQAEGRREDSETLAGLSSMLEALNTETKETPRAAKRVRALWTDNNRELLALLNHSLNKSGETFKSFLFIEPQNDAKADALFDQLEKELDADVKKQIASEIADLLIE